ncbi:MAG: hypothetical protein ACFWUC_13100 [Oscillospiraceae bacterium]|jgi:hypothetical protein
MLDLKNIYNDVIDEIRNMSDAEFLNEILAVKLNFCEDCFEPLTSYQVNFFTGSEPNDSLTYSNLGVLAA